jgi:cytochrome P450
MMRIPAMGETYDLYGDRFRASTHETFARMRADDPVCRHSGRDGRTMLWFVSRYDDVVSLLLDDEQFVRDPALALNAEELAAHDKGADVFKYVDTHMLNREGDEHRRLRRLVARAFTPRMVERLRPRVQEIADALIDGVEPLGEMDLVDSFAFPLPITVIAELLGIPAADRTRFRSWSNAIVSHALVRDDMPAYRAEMAEFVDYLRRLFESRRGSSGDDLVSALLRVEEAGDVLSEHELSSMVALLIIAGHETTVSLIANAVLALLERPDERERLLREPECFATAIDELVRFDGPVERALHRWARKDVVLGGKTIRRGEGVIAILGSANRDPARFAHPDELDLERRDNPHVGFGRGSHYCLGAPLARLETEVALATLFRRLPTLRLAASLHELRWRPVPMFRSLVSLPVAWDADQSTTN